MDHPRTKRLDIRSNAPIKYDTRQSQVTLAQLLVKLQAQAMLA